MQARKPMTQKAVDKMQKLERQRSLRKIKIMTTLRKGVGYSVLLVSLAIALLSAISLANLSDVQLLKTVIVIVTLGSVIFVMFYRIVQQLGGHLARSIFATTIIILTVIGIFLMQ